LGFIETFIDIKYEDLFSTGIWRRLGW